jgi:hypothetical protein
MMPTRSDVDSLRSEVSRVIERKLPAYERCVDARWWAIVRERLADQLALDGQPSNTLQRQREQMLLELREHVLQREARPRWKGTWGWMRRLLRRLFSRRGDPDQG